MDVPHVVKLHQKGVCFFDVKNTNVGWLTKVGIPKFLAMILDTQLECEGSEMIRMLSFRRSLVFLRSATGSS